MTDTPDDDTPAPVGAEPAPVSLSDHLRAWPAAIQKWAQPPDLWNEGRPSLRQSWIWARHGEHLPDVDVARLGSRIGAGITIPARALLLGIDWTLERPSRLVAAALLGLTCWMAFVA